MPPPQTSPADRLPAVHRDCIGSRAQFGEVVVTEGLEVCKKSVQNGMFEARSKTCEHVGDRFGCDEVLFRAQVLVKFTSGP